MIVSRVTPPTEVEGAEVGGAERVGGVANPDHLKQNCTSLRLTVTTLMAHIMWKWSETGKGKEKLHKILVIMEGKMSLSRDVEFLYTSRIEIMKWEGKSIARCFKKERKN